MNRSRLRSVLLVAVAGGGLLSAGFALAGGLTINLTATGPSPPTATAVLGDTVTFVNADAAPHSVSARRVGITSPELAPGQSFSYVLTTAGSIRYREQAKRPLPGQIVVQKPSAPLTLTGSARTVVYGRSLVLRGVSPLPASEVTLRTREPGAAAWRALVSLMPAADGTYSTSVRPERRATYQATQFGGEIASPLVTVVVAPRLTAKAYPARAPTGAPIRVSVRIVPAAAAKALELRRYAAEQHEWRRVETRPVVDGVATFTWKLEQGRSLLRGWLRRSGAQAGYEPAFSAQILVVGTGAPPETAKKKGRRG